MASKITFPVSVQETTKSLLRILPSRRMREVLVERFGLKGGSRKTLDAIGKRYKITRERVRQIQADALRNLGKAEHEELIMPVVRTLEGHFKRHGSVLSEQQLTDDLGGQKTYQHAELILTISPLFERIAETTHERTSWGIHTDTAKLVQRVVRDLHGHLREHGRPISSAALHDAVRERCIHTLGYRPDENTVRTYLGISNQVAMNAYGDYGLASSVHIVPRGVKDKAYLVLEKAQKPLHFRDVAGEINKAGWSSKKAHPQTVHNELIKDNRFVLVGRGLYALTEWGYEQGTVKDILVSLMKQKKSAISRDDLIKGVLERRVVKVPTILLNLNNKSLFKHIGGERYMLA